MKRLGAALALLAALHCDAQTVVLYAHDDRASAMRIRDVVALHNETTLDRDIPAGVPWRQAMALAIVRARTVLVAWSRSAAASPEIGAEWRLAIATGARVVPVLLDDAPMPAELAARQWIDWR